MEKPEQRFVVKFFFRKGVDFKRIHRKLTAIFSSTAYSLTQIEEWRARFETGDCSCEDQSMPNHSLYVLGKLSPISLRDFFLRLQKLLHNTSVNRDTGSKRSSSRSLGCGDSLEGGYYIRSQSGKRPIGERWQLTCRVSSIAKWIILFLELWQGTNLGFSVRMHLTIFSQRVEMK
jgi:hypothetical protein